jgi:riboflavin synthase
MEFVHMNSFVEICPMFTGIIEKTGIIMRVFETGSNKIFWLKSSITKKLKVDQSVCHDGICLTIEEIKGNQYRVTAIAETISKTSLGSWQPGYLVNLERCLKLNGRLDGHLVQGHVDTPGTCILKKETRGSWNYVFEFPEKFAELIIEKGSITVHGISLTAFNVTNKTFEVAIIPYTFENTNIKNVASGDKVNLEFDLLGKYISRKLSLNK